MTDKDPVEKNVFLLYFSPAAEKEIAKKIIATTDSSLGLPQIPELFIKKFIEEYNKVKRNS